MARTCSLCTHGQRRQIESLILENVSNRAIARQFGVSKDSVSRHKAQHLPKVAVQAATDDRQYDHFRKLKILEKTLYTILKRSLEDGDDPTALRTHGSLLKHYEFELKLGELEDVKRDLEELREEIERREIER
jgi:IS30 family transposase